MLLNIILDRFAKRAPINVMVRAALEYALAPDALDALFRDTAELQHEKSPPMSVKVASSQRTLSRPSSAPSLSTLRRLGPPQS